MTHRDDQKLQIQQATDIVRLIGDEISLRPKGREHVGLCPFHDDKNPSFHVSATKQIFKCFSCGIGGDAFSFVMNYHKMTFPEAMAFLAQRAGIELKPSQRGHPDSAESSRGERQLIADANQRALGFFRAVFAHEESGAIARRYVQNRQISPQIAQVFQLGYAPDQWDGLAGMIGKQGWGYHGFERAGLVGVKKQSHGRYDRFRHRLVFPILDVLGRPIAFGARRLNDHDEPKYLNSPESPLFNKSMTLYGLHVAKKPIIEHRTAVVVEGYTDVIACHQAGLGHVVATLGTAFTRKHAEVLSRLCDRVVLIFDADQAGQKAADRAVDVFLSGSMDVAVAVLPDGLDPAGLLVRPDGFQQLRQHIDRAAGALEYKLGRMRAQLDAADTLTGRERVAGQYLQELVRMGVLGQSAIRKAMVVGRVADALGISQRAVDDHLKQLSAAATRGRQAYGQRAERDTLSGTNEDNLQTGVAWPDSAHKIRALRLAERHVIGCLLRRPALFHQRLSDGMTLDEALTPAEMVTPQAQALYTRLYERLCDDGALTLSKFLAQLSVDEEQDLANLATHAEVEVEARCGDDSQRLETQLREAAESILLHHKERWYKQYREALFGVVAHGRRSAIDESQLNELAEHRRNNPSAVRIARSIVDK